MKKFIIASALALLAISTAFAQTAATVGTEYTRASPHYETSVAVTQATKLGTVGLTAMQLGWSQPWGASATYSLPAVQLGKLAVTAGGSIGQLDLGRSATNFYTAGASVKLPLSSAVAVFGDYRFRAPLTSGFLAENRYRVGVELALSKRLALEAGANTTRSASRTENGGFVQATVKF